MGSRDGTGWGEFERVRPATGRRPAELDDSLVPRPVGATPEIPGEGRGGGALARALYALLARPGRTRLLCRRVPHLERRRVRGDPERSAYIGGDGAAGRGSS